MHYSGHVREAFANWVYEGMPETATVEVDYEEQEFSSEELVGEMGGCSDIMPSILCDELQLPQGSTYGQAARRLLGEELNIRAV